MTKNNKPAHEVRIGRVKATIWANKTAQNDTWHNITLARVYKDGDSWKESDSFGRKDLYLLRNVLSEAIEWMMEHPPVE